MARMLMALFFLLACVALAYTACYFMAGCFGAGGLGHAATTSAGALKPPTPDTNDPFWMLKWVGGLSLLAGVVTLIASANPALSVFIPIKAAARAIIAGVVLLILNALLVKFLKPLAWISGVTAALAIIPLLPLWWKGLRAWSRREVASLEGRPEPMP